MAAPTIVLIHGAFADAGSWAPVTRILLDAGHTVVAPANPNRRLDTDAAYARKLVEQIEGPVLLAGHSYGGAIITIAGAADNVVGLVYVAGYALDEGETLTQLQARFPDSDLPQHLVAQPVTLPDGSEGTDLTVAVDAFLPTFAAGLDPKTAELLAVGQRPLATAAFDIPASVAAWKTKPSWGIVSAADRTINPDVERFGYERAAMKGIVELPSPHLVMQTHPAEVAKVITDAIASLG